MNEIPLMSNRLPFEAKPVNRAVAYRLDVAHLGESVAPESHLLARRRLLVGRGEANDVRLCSALRMVSQYHLMLYHEEGRYWARDVGSKNGTWHNGARLPQGVSVRLSDGDTLQVGDFLLTFFHMDQS
jgi:pSer/pThr/pTyr-binding forkhead associated (FHA) protein